MIIRIIKKWLKVGNKANKEKEIVKIVEIIITLGEKESKEILTKLLKSFPKGSELNQKLFNLISAKISSNININAKLKGNQGDF